MEIDNAPADRAAVADTVKPVVRRDWYPSGTMEQALSLEDPPEFHEGDTANWICPATPEAIPKKFVQIMQEKLT